MKLGRFSLGGEGWWIESRQHGINRLYSWWRVVPLLLLLPVMILALFASVHREIDLLPIYPRDWVQVAREALRANVENLFWGQAEKGESALPTVQIGLPSNSLMLLHDMSVRGDERLGRTIGGTKVYVDATYVDESDHLRAAKISYRGLSPWHHFPSKPSLRVRFSKKDIRNGPRYVELERPEDALALANWLPSKLAKNLGVVTGKIDHVRLFINKKFFGVYLRTLRIGDSLAMRNDRPLGAFAKGDLVETSSSSSPSLWENLEAWRIEGPDIEAAKVLLKKLVTTVAMPASPQSMEALPNILDVDAYARYMALLILVGSLHSDDSHNQVFYLDSARELWEPVLWDANGFGIHALPHAPIDAVRNRIVEILLRNPEWRHSRNLYLFKLVEGEGSYLNQQKEIRAALGRLLPDLRSDSNLGNLTYSNSGFRLVPVGVASLEAQVVRLESWIRLRTTFISAYLSHAQCSVSSAVGGQTDIAIKGNVAVRVRRKDARPFSSNGRMVTQIVLHPNFSTNLVEFANRPAGERNVPLFAPVAVDTNFRIDAPPSTLIFENGVTGATIVPDGINLN